MSEWLILIFVLYILYSIMKKSNTTTEKSAPKSKVEEPVNKVAETKATKPVSTPKPPKEPKKVAAPKAAPKASVIESEKLAPDAAVKKATVTKSSATPKTPAKPKVEAAPKAAKVTSEAPMPERVGLTAGSIWHYLSENGATSVTKVVKEIQEEEKIIQRSIGWLAQEDKITLDTINQVETIALKG